MIPVINRIAKGFDNVVMTQDWHTAHHISFASTHDGKKPFESDQAPVRQAGAVAGSLRAGTEGASLSPRTSRSRMPGLVIRKGFHKDVDSYSAFTEADGKTTTGLAAYLKARKVEAGIPRRPRHRLLRGMERARRAQRRPQTYVIEDACRGIDTQGSLAKAWADMTKAGVKRIKSEDIAA